MFFKGIFYRIRISAAVFCANFFASECKAIEDLAWKGIEDFGHVRGMVPSGDSREEPFESSILFALSCIMVVGIVVIITCVCICCFCRRFYSKNASNTTIRQEQTTTARFGIRSSVDFGLGNPSSALGNPYGSGIVNLAFNGGFETSTPARDDPPAYNSVILETSVKTVSIQHPRIIVAETPPPAYMTLAPFK